MTWNEASAVSFAVPIRSRQSRVHHAEAADRNRLVADLAAESLDKALSGSEKTVRILLKAAAGAGKSYLLMQLVANAVDHPVCDRVAVVAFTNKQIHQLASSLGKKIGKERVCLFVAESRYEEIPEEAHANATVATSTSDIPQECAVIVSTAHKLGAIGELNRLKGNLGVAHNDTAPFDVLFIDEAWQLPHHLYAKVSNYAPISVGVGDVGQLPPLEVGTNPWRGDPSYNPYRAWPTEATDERATLEVELPTVWRPAAGQLELWRAFYPDWIELDCVAAPGDRVFIADGLSGTAKSIWTQVGTGVPTLLEVKGLPEPEAPDIDLPLMKVVEELLDDLLTSDFRLQTARYDDAGRPNGDIDVQRPGRKSGDPLVAILATRNQAVDDATDVVERLRKKHGLTENDIVASTVDSWQGQTNGITIALHPLSGASELDEFNSAFGRLAVTCTRATHGLLLVARAGLEHLLDVASARPGTPYGEPGNRHLPRQTHKRILESFARGTLLYLDSP